MLTAGHCAIRIGDTVTVGRGYLPSTGGEKRQVSAFAKMFYNSTYCQSHNGNLCDVALVKLDRSSDQPDLDLASPSVLPEWGVGTSARRYGYGPRVIVSPVTSSYLKRAHVRIDAFRGDGHTLEASGPGDATCAGDSGGPLLVSTSDRPRVVGIVQRGADDGSPCTPGDRQVYVKVGYRGSANSRPYDWIVAST